MHCNSKIPKAEQLAAHAHHTCFCFAELGPSNTKSSQSSQFGSALIPKITEGGADYGLWEAEPVRAGLRTKAQLWFPSCPMLSQGVYPGQASLPAKLLQKACFWAHLLAQSMHPQDQFCRGRAPHLSSDWNTASLKSQAPGQHPCPLDSLEIWNSVFTDFIYNRQFCNW